MFLTKGVNMIFAQCLPKSADTAGSAYYFVGKDMDSIVAHVRDYRDFYACELETPCELDQRELSQRRVCIAMLIGVAKRRITAEQNVCCYLGFTPRAKD